MPSIRDSFFSFHAIGDHDVIYFISEEDTTGPQYFYYGYLNSTGGWYILREDTTNKQYRYAIGETDFPTNWTARASLTYYLYNKLFEPPNI